MAPMPTVARLVEAMEAIAPIALAEAWDNVGLLVGDPAREIGGPVVLTIDLTEPVTREALEARAGAVVAYHPPIFHARTRLTSGDGLGRSLLALIEAGVSIYSPHTALDAAEGGVADWLLERVLEGPAGVRRAVAPHQRLTASQTHKLVTFVPAGDADRLRAALSEAGAGTIGAYSECSFGVAGRGTFFGSEGTNPAVGERGRLERVDEVRMEMVCPATRLADVVAALRAVHPYEEPAFDLYALAATPDACLGAGRLGTLEAPTAPSAVAARLKANLGVDGVELAANSDDPITRVGVCPGAGASLLDEAIAAGAELFVTGEMRHHEVLGALDRGCGVLLAGHTNTERGYLPRLAARLNGIDGSFDARVSGADRAPLRVL